MKSALRPLLLVLIATPAHADLPRLIIFGGGVEPASTQASIEAQTAELVKVLGPRGPQILFGGPESGARQVQIVGRPDPTGELLGAIFERPDSIRVEYRQSTLQPGGPATKPALLEALAARSEAGTIVFGVGHGTLIGDNEAALSLWGSQGTLGLRELAEALDGAGAGPTAFVLGQCYSGGFVDLVYRQAAVNKPLAEPGRCVFAAVPPGETASGCTADLDDPSARSYLGEIARGLASAEADYDRDGLISVAEAHAFARLHDETVNVPIASSERLLERALPKKPTGGAIAELLKKAPVAEAAVLSGLLPAALSGGKVKDVEAALRRVKDQADAADRTLAQSEERARNDAGEIRDTLLTRWPELANPLHRRSREILAGEAPAVMEAIQAHPRFADFLAARTEAGDLAADLLDIERQEARLLRWTRAADLVLRRTGRLDKKTQKDLARLDACERLAVQRAPE